MPDFKGDQAEGLRQLLHRPTAQIVRLASGCRGVGKTSVTVNVAVALAARGARVLLIDGNHGPANVSALLGVQPRCALENFVRNECTFDHALMPVAHGVTVLPAAGAARSLPSWDTAARARLSAALKSLHGRFDVVLVDTPCDREDAVDLFAGSVCDTIVVSSTAKHAVMASYALIKRLRGAGRQDRFHMLLNQVVIEETARVILHNLMDVARGHLQTPVASLGCVPADERLRAAGAGCHSVVHAYPSSPSALRLRHIAEAITGWPGHRARHNPMDGFMRQVLAGGHPVLTTSGT